MIDELLTSIVACRPVHEDRAALIESAQAEIDTILVHVNWYTTIPPGANDDAKDTYGMLAGPDEMNKKINEEACGEEQSVVVMLRGWHEFRRGKLAICPPTLADWLISIRYARWLTDEEMVEANREDVPLPDPADRWGRLRTAGRIHQWPTQTACA